jgi:hypothetical protein
MRGAEIIEKLSGDSVTLSKCIGVFAIDRLPSNVPVDRFCICNTDKWSDEGKHWIVIYFPPQDETEYFDPLGNDPRGEFIRFMGEKYKHNTQRYQPLNSNTCANYCIFFAYMKCRGLPFELILKLLGTEKNVVRFVDNM